MVWKFKGNQLVDMIKIERTDIMDQINEISIGDTLWLIEELDQIGWMGNMNHNHHGVLVQPYETKVVAIIQTENGFFYQVRNECTLSATNIGTIAFPNKEDALKELQKRRKDIMEEELVIENINVGDVLLYKGDSRSRVVCIERNKQLDNRYSTAMVIDESSIKHRTTDELSTEGDNVVTEIDYYTAKNWLVVQKKKYDISTYRMVHVLGER